ncbi:hypothetical protein BKA70DRAFT_1235280 [Coprinopsis sp. MPI-PUGE-AT-0042]|nr:hypothetical protein BKA70DRAFT_1235280 [Coprinopsis sp. MPI-PUGE-AT-0042]
MSATYDWSKHWTRGRMSCSASLQAPQYMGTSGMPPYPASPSMPSSPDIGTRAPTNSLDYHHHLTQLDMLAVPSDNLMPVNRGLSYANVRNTQPEAQTSRAASRPKPLVATSKSSMPSRCSVVRLAENVVDLRQGIDNVEQTQTQLLNDLKQVYQRGLYRSSCGVDKGSSAIAKHRRPTNNHSSRPFTPNSVGAGRLLVPAQPRPDTVEVYGPDTSLRVNTFNVVVGLLDDATISLWSRLKSISDRARSLPHDTVTVSGKASNVFIAASTTALSNDPIMAFTEDARVNRLYLLCYQATIDILDYDAPEGTNVQGQPPAIFHCPRSVYKVSGPHVFPNVLGVDKRVQWHIFSCGMLLLFLKNPSWQSNAESLEWSLSPM